MSDIYHAPHLKRKNISVSLEEEKTLLGVMNARGDAESIRLQRYLDMPDLTRLKGNPIKTVTDIVLSLPSLENFDIIDTPEVISAEVVFDLFNFPKDHPARSRSDTYYVDKEHILRPHTSLMWKYYLELPEIRQQLEEHGSVGAISYGKVYRRDEIDWQHTNVFHHIDGFFVIKKDLKVIGQKDLQDILVEVAQALYGQDVNYRFNVDHFPYTDPSLEMEIAWSQARMSDQLGEDDKWIEILGAGVIHPQVIDNLGYDSKIYSGWAFGFGVDRLAMLKLRLPDIRLLRSTDKRVTDQFKDLNVPYTPVSKFPPAPRDISFIVEDKKFNVNAYYELAREVVGDEFIEEIKLLDKYEDESKFGEGKLSYTYRITYRSLDRTLTGEEVDKFHKDLEMRTVQEFGAVIR